MTPKDFHIGVDFYCAGKRWRCTDVGSRVIAAISLEPHEVVSIESNSIGPSEHRYSTGDPSWLLGPPYALAEQVFDENDLELCELIEFSDKNGL